MISKRPLSVTFIGWLFIAAGTVGIVYHATEFKGLSPFDYEVAWALIVRALAIVGGVFLLRGSKWARWLVVAWISYHVILSAFHSVPELVIHALLTAAIAYILFRPRSSAYFLAPKTRTSAEP